MKVVFFKQDSIVRKLDEALQDARKQHTLTGAKVAHVDLSRREYQQLLEELGAPSGAAVPQYEGVSIWVDGEPAQVAQQRQAQLATGGRRG